MGKTLETVTTLSKSSLNVGYNEYDYYSAIEHKNSDGYQLIKMFYGHGDEKYILGYKKILGKDFNILSVRSWMELFELRKQKNQGIS